MLKIILIYKNKFNFLFIMKVAFFLPQQVMKTKFKKIWWEEFNREKTHNTLEKQKEDDDTRDQNSALEMDCFCNSNFYMYQFNTTFCI